MGQRYNVDLYVMDEEGGEQGPNIAATWEITQPTIYLPSVYR
jgi:hypothetical protein